MRMLSSYKREVSTTWVSYFIRGQIDRVISLVPHGLLPLVFQLMAQQMPALAKAPLVRSGKGIEYRNNHNIVGGSFFRENCVVVHFKFLSDFAARVKIKVARGEHYRRGAEYFRYSKAIAQRRELCLAYENSREFDGVNQLVEIGLIRDIRKLLSQGFGQQEFGLEFGSCQEKALTQSTTHDSAPIRHTKPGRLSETAEKNV